MDTGASSMPSVMAKAHAVVRRRGSTIGVPNEGPSMILSRSVAGLAAPIGAQTRQMHASDRLPRHGKPAGLWLLREGESGQHHRVGIFGWARRQIAEGGWQMRHLDAARFQIINQRDTRCPRLIPEPLGLIALASALIESSTVADPARHGCCDACPGLPGWKP